MVSNYKYYKWDVGWGNWDKIGPPCYPMFNKPHMSIFLFFYLAIYLRLTLLMVFISILGIIEGGWDETGKK